MTSIKNKSSLVSTVMGYLVAIATALSTINFKEFEWEKEWVHIVCCVLIAIGGHMTRVTMMDKK